MTTELLPGCVNRLIAKMAKIGEIGEIAKVAKVVKILQMNRHKRTRATTRAAVVRRLLPVKMSPSHGQETVQVAQYDHSLKIHTINKIIKDL